MNGPLDELYFRWLYRQIGSLRMKHPSRTYWSLARQLFTKEFVWIIPNDDNRVEDGRDLRHEFIRENDFDDIDPDWMELGCSVLEMLIALSRRVAFETNGLARDWFWSLIENLEIVFNDEEYDDKAQKEIDKVLDTLIWRTYSPNGEGGLFPLEDPRGNQQDVEIWYQASAYLLERL